MKQYTIRRAVDTDNPSIEDRLVTKLSQCGLSTKAVCAIIARTTGQRYSDSQIVYRRRLFDASPMKWRSGRMDLSWARVAIKHAEATMERAEDHIKAIKAMGRAAAARRSA